VARGSDHDAQLAQAGFDVAADGYLVPMPNQNPKQLIDDPEGAVANG
jgi:hypothetical protein